MDTTAHSVCTVTLPLWYCRV